MIFQLSDWFPKPMIWAIIVKFDQKRKNWWRISCAEILEVAKNCFAASSVKKMSRFEEVSPEEIKRIAWKFTKTVILLARAGYELIIYISSYPARPRRITVKYVLNWGKYYLWLLKTSRSNVICIVINWMVRVWQRSILTISFNIVILNIFMVRGNTWPYMAIDS